jgi:hypothetical protein
MASTVVTVDKEMVDNLRKAIDDCADRGLQIASKWYASLPPFPPSSQLSRPHRHRPRYPLFKFIPHTF